MNKVTINLNQLTQKYRNEQDEWFFIKGAIKSAIVDSKLQYGRDVEIYFIERRSDNVAFDMAINGMAKQMIAHWEV